MIIELLLMPMFGLIGLIVDIIPDMSGINPLSEFSADLSGFIDFLAYGFLIFPFPLFLAFISNVLFWLSLQLPWAIVVWVYNKIPGVN